MCSEPEQLSDNAAKELVSQHNELYLSYASSWEISIKYNNQALKLPSVPEKFVPLAREKIGIAGLPIEEAAIFHLSALPKLHKDPFDRLLVSQAILGDFHIVTPDKKISQYGIKVLW